VRAFLDAAQRSGVLARSSLRFEVSLAMEGAAANHAASRTGRPEAELILLAWPP